MTYLKSRIKLRGFEESTYLQWEEVLRPEFGVIQRIEVILVLICRIHGLNGQSPGRVVACSDGIHQVLGGMAVVCTTDKHCLIVEQILDSTSGIPVELHVRFLASLVDKLHRNSNKI